MHWYYSLSFHPKDILVGEAKILISKLLPASTTVTVEICAICVAGHSHGVLQVEARMSPWYVVAENMISGEIHQ